MNKEKHKRNVKTLYVIIALLIIIAVLSISAQAALYTYYEYDPWGKSAVGNLTINCASLGPDYFVQNISGVLGSQCRYVNTSGGGGSGTVTSIVFANGFNRTTITSSGTVGLNFSEAQARVSSTCASGSSIRVINSDGTVTCENDSEGITSLATTAGILGGPITSSGTIQLDNAYIVAALGNWSADKANYATIAWVLTAGNYSLEKSSILTNISNLQLNVSNLNNMINTLNTSRLNNESLLNNMINTLNTTKAAIGTCAAGTVVQNNTATGVQCIAVGTGNSSGTVTSIATDEGILGGTITSTGTLRLNNSYLVAALGNFSAFMPALYNNISALQLNVSNINAMINTLNTSRLNNESLLNNMINTLNTTRINNVSNINAMINTLNTSRLNNESLLNNMINTLNTSVQTKGIGNITGNMTSGRLQLAQNGSRISDSLVSQSGNLVTISGSANITSVTHTPNITWAPGVSAWYNGSHLCIMSC